MTDSKASRYRLHPWLVYGDNSNPDGARSHGQRLKLKLSVLVSLVTASMVTLPAMVPRDWVDVRASDWGEYIPAVQSEMPTVSSAVSELPPVHISSSSPINPFNSALGTEFLAQVPGANVAISSRDTQAALDAVQSGDIDLAIVDRPLTPDEIAMGLVAVPIGGDLAYVYDGPTPPETAQPFLEFVEDPDNQETVENAVALVKPTEPTSASESAAESGQPTPASEPHESPVSPLVTDKQTASPNLSETPEPLPSESATGPTNGDDVALVPSPDGSVTDPGGTTPFPWGWLALPLLGLPLLFWLFRGKRRPADQGMQDWTDVELPDLPPPAPSVPTPTLTTATPTAPKNPPPAPTPEPSEPSFTPVNSPPSRPATAAGLGALAAAAGLAAAMDDSADDVEDSHPVNVQTPVQGLTIESEMSDAVTVRWSMPVDQRVALLDTYSPRMKIYDATWINLDYQPAHSIDTYPVTDEALEGEMASMVLPVSRCDRDYLAELGYLDETGTWVSLGRSLHTYVACAAEPVMLPDPVLEKPDEPSISPC